MAPGRSVAWDRRGSISDARKCYAQPEIMSRPVQRWRPDHPSAALRVERYAKSVEEPLQLKCAAASPPPTHRIARIARQ